MELAWKPLDLNAYQALLVSPVSLWPKWICNRLLDNLSEELGVGGPAFRYALEEIAYKRQEFETDGEAESNSGLLDEITLILEERFDPTKGIPVNALQQRCDLVIRRLERMVRKQRAIGEPVSASLFRGISNVRELELMFSSGTISRTELRQGLSFLNSQPGGSSETEVAPWTVIKHPGRVERCRTFIWWDFHNPDNATAIPWNEAEIGLLESQNVKLDTSQCRRMRQSRAGSIP